MTESTTASALPGASPKHTTGAGASVPVAGFECLVHSRIAFVQNGFQHHFSDGSQAFDHSGNPEGMQASLDDSSKDLANISTVGFFPYASMTLAKAQIAKNLFTKNWFTKGESAQVRVIETLC